MRQRVLTILAILSGLTLYLNVFSCAPALALSLARPVSAQALPGNTPTPTPLVLGEPVNLDSLLTIIGILALVIVFGGGALVIRVTDTEWQKER